MIVEETPLAGALLIKPKVWGDARGYFVETWSLARYAAAGVGPGFVQDNHSRSGRGVLRGLHFQRRWPQGKLVRVSRGEIFDVAVDVRPDSPTLGRWFAARLSGENQHQLWIPPGLAHGFCVLSEEADLHYKCTEYYHPEDEGTIRWDDPDLNIPWPALTPRVSEKDAAGRAFAAYLADLERL